MDWKLFCSNRRWEILHVGCSKESDITVSFSSEFNRKPCPSTDVTMDEKWRQLVSGNSRLFNGQKFRLNAIKKSPSKIELEVGLTDYKTAMCTNHCDDQPSLGILRKHGLELYGDSQSCFANPIAVNVVVITSDDRMVFIRRADWVGEAKGLLDVPGGHAEPEELFNATMGDSKVYEDVHCDKIVHEIFHSIAREIRDELNVPEESIEWPTMTGLLRNKDAAGKPCFTFKTRCCLSSEEILKRYKEGGKETDESTELIFIPIKELNLLEEENKWSKLVNQAAPCGQGAVYMTFLG